MKGIFNKLNSQERRDLFKEVHFTEDEMRSKLSSFNLTYDKYSMWDNKTISLRSINLNYIASFDLCTINCLCLSSYATKYDLKYNGYPRAGVYIADVLLNKYCDLYIDDFGEYRINHCSFTSDKCDEFKEIFFNELKKVIDDTTKRITIKNKKDEVKNKLSHIESELDYVILNFAEDHKDNGLTLKIDNEPYTNSVAIEYTLDKSMSGYSDFKGPKMIIRKLKTGRFTSTYIKTETYDQDFSNWKTFKKDLTADELNYYIDSYFKPWYNVPNKIQFNYVTSLFI